MQMAVFNRNYKLPKCDTNAFQKVFNWLEAASLKIRGCGMEQKFQLTSCLLPSRLEEQIVYFQAQIERERGEVNLGDSIIVTPKANY